MEEGGIISTSGTMLRSVGDKAAGSPGVFSEPGILFLSPPLPFGPSTKFTCFSKCKVPDCRAGSVRGDGAAGGGVQGQRAERLEPQEPGANLPGQGGQTQQDRPPRPALEHGGGIPAGVGGPEAGGGHGGAQGAGVLGGAEAPPAVCGVWGGQGDSAGPHGRR